MNPSELVSDINVFNNRLVSVIEALRPSLEIDQSREAVSPFKDYLDQVRYCLEQVSRFYDQLSRVPEQPAYLSQELSRLGPAVSTAEDGVSRIRAILPSVKLPTDKAWMTHVEQQGNEGIVKVTIIEVGPSARVQQNWTGGDGSMSGTVIVTIIPYQDIGSLDVEVPTWSDEHRWTVRIESTSRNGFPQSVVAPERRTAARTYAAVDLNDTEQYIYLEFSNLNEAQDAYDFFTYHQQRRS